MTPLLPLPVRVAAGLVVTAVEQARELPRLALELPVTAVSQALQASMRVQQKVTELAIKGDRVLGTGTPVEDEPAWATFDDDPPPRRNGSEAFSSPDRFSPGPATVTTLRRAADPLDEPGLGEPGLGDPGLGGPGLGGPGLGGPGLGGPGLGGPGLGGPGLGEPGLGGPGPVDPGPIDPGSASPEPVPTGPPGGTDGPDVLPGYAHLTIPQLRGKLRHLGLDDLRALLAWEQAHGDRPPYVTMLSNRIATVSDR